MSIYDRLKQDHREVEALFEEIRAASDDPALRLELFEEMREALLAHAHAEDRVLYTRLEDEHADAIEHGRDEHDEVEDKLLEMSQMEDPEDARWFQLFDEVVQGVKEHVEEEENELFPKARQSLGDDASGELEAELAEGEDEERRDMDAPA